MGEKWKVLTMADGCIWSSKEAEDRYAASEQEWRRKSAMVASGGAGNGSGRRASGAVPPAPRYPKDFSVNEERRATIEKATGMKAGSLDKERNATTNLQPGRGHGIIFDLDDDAGANLFDHFEPADLVRWMHW